MSESGYLPVTSSSSAAMEGVLCSLEAAAMTGDVTAVRALVADGFDLNSTDDLGDSVLGALISRLSFAKEARFRYDVIRELLKQGANPSVPCAEGAHPLFLAVLDMDTELLRILLDAGTDPNSVPMDTDVESLYDWAEFDYRYEVWNIDALPENPTEQDREDEDAWLRFLDRLAVQHGRRRPDHLQLLRARGARTMRELRSTAAPR